MRSRFAYLIYTYEVTSFPVLFLLFSSIENFLNDKTKLASVATDAPRPRILPGPGDSARRSARERRSRASRAEVFPARRRHPASTDAPPSSRETKTSRRPRGAPLAGASDDDPRRAGAERSRVGPTAEPTQRPARARSAPRRLASGDSALARGRPMDGAASRRRRSDAGRLPRTVAAPRRRDHADAIGAIRTAGRHSAFRTDGGAPPPPSAGAPRVPPSRRRPTRSEEAAAARPGRGRRRSTNTTPVRQRPGTTGSFFERILLPVRALDRSIVSPVAPASFIRRLASFTHAS
jgi:hypothetical protein